MSFNEIEAFAAVMALTVAMPVVSRFVARVRDWRLQPKPASAQSGSAAIETAA